MGEKMRIYIGRLGASVMEDDLKKTFTSPLLGTVESVEIIRSKSRSFAYLDFVPASEKGLAKLFSTYNGCMWKGGRLKLEKAKEHYLFRLRREWTEDAELAIKLASQKVDTDESMHSLQTTKKDLDIEQMHLWIFFPKLRKVKPLPLKGTGRHKYSFQRVEIPLLPIHFCDCEEHSVPTESAKKKFSDDHDTETCGVNEEELSMVKSVLNKLLERENCSKTVSNEAEFTEEIYPSIYSVDNLQVNDNEEDSVSDVDGLVINMVSRSSNGVALFKDWRQETTTVDQDSLLRKPQTLTGKHIPEMHGSQKRKLVPDNKRKASLCEDDANVTAPSKRKARKGSPHHHIGDLQIAVNTQPTETGLGATQLSCDVVYSRKLAWRDLVSQKESAAFHISDVLTDHSPVVEVKPRPNLLTTPSSEKDKQENQSSEYKELEKLPGIQPELEKLPDIQPIEPSMVEDKKSARGASWLQKSSWLQLVGNTNNSSFNLAQILPGLTLEKQELQQFCGYDFSSSRNGKQPKFVPKDQNYPVEDINIPQRRANREIYAATGENPNVDALTKEQNHSSLVGEQSNSDEQQTVEQEDEASALMPGIKLPVAINRVPIPVPDIVISDTCPFMRSAASMKEWVKTKAALSGSHKKKGKKMSGFSDY